MHTQTIRTGLTAAMTAGRALLAAGWRYDSTTPMADDTTIRTLLHPSGREIHARTVDRDGDDTTTLTMTGLDLTQVAGAITGAGLVETTAEQGATPVSRDDVQNLRDAITAMARRYADSARDYAYAITGSYHADERMRLLSAEQRRFKSLQRLTWALANLAAGGAR